MKKISLILAIFMILVVLLSACSEQQAPRKITAAKKIIVQPEPIAEQQINVKRILSGETEQMRAMTYDACSDLINQTVTIKGRVLFEECGKNQLGGAPGSGPAYCYYGIQSENCLIYYESQVDGGDRFPQANEIINVLNENQQVELTGKVIHHIVRFGCLKEHSKAECSYFILE